MKKGGITLAVIGAVGGVLIGLGILAVQGYIAQTLTTMLDEEAQKACGCRFKADDVDVSLLTLSAVARGARIESQSQPALRFNRVHAYFGLRKIQDRQVNINLALIDGHATAVDPESPAVKFIGSLAAPIPPERDRPGRWKLKLQQLKMSGSSFEQTLGDAKLNGEGASLLVQRDERNNFWLTPAIASLKYTSGGTASGITLGRLSSKLYLQDEVADFQKIELLLKKAFLSGDFKIFIDRAGESLGKFQYALDSESLNLENGIQFGLKGDAALEGAIDEPKLSGSLELTDQKDFSLGNREKPLITFDQGRAAWSMHLGSKSTSASISQFQMTGPQASVHLLEPISLKNSQLGGVLEFKIDELALDAFVFKGIRLATSLDGNIDRLLLNLRFESTELAVGNLVFPGPTLNATLADQELQFNLSQKIGAREALASSGTVLLDMPTPRFKDTRIQLAELPLVLPSGKILPFTIKGSGTLDGTWSTPQFTGLLDLEIAPVDFPEGTKVALNAKLSNGELSVKGGTNDQALAIDGKLFPNAQQPGSLAVHLRNFLPEKLSPDFGCLSFTGDLDYRFLTNTFALGDGSLNLSKAAVGCGEYGLNLAAPIHAPIQSGTIDLSSIALVNDHSNVIINGTISAKSGYNVDLKGMLDLSSLLGVLTSVDDLDGTLTADLGMKGPLDAPKLHGMADLNGARFESAAADLSADRVQGKIEFAEDKVTFKNVTGILNSGTFELTGDVYPLNIEASRAEAKFAHILFEPDNQTSAIFSGTLMIERSSFGKPLLAGAIAVESAEFRDSVNLQTLIRMLSEVIMSPRTRRKMDRELPNIDLNIQVTASRNVFVLTNVATMELALDLNLGGSLPNPSIAGTVTTLTGWIGLKNRRFEITSGNLIFRPGSLTPELDLIGESSIVSRNGEDVVVLLQASGPLTNPRFTLSSDLGLNEREILRIISEGGYNRNETESSNMRSGFDEQESSLLSDFLTLNLRRVFRNLTRIDSIFLEPIYNPQTGVVEPGVIAEKRLAERLKIQGESSFSESTNYARAKAVYDLSSDVGLAALIETDATQKTNPVEFNVTYTALSRQAQLLDIEVTGAEHFEESRILKAVRLGPFSRVNRNDCMRIGEAVTTWYHSAGYQHAAVTAECLAGDTLCRRLKIQITENVPTFLADIKLRGDTLPAAVEEKVKDVFRVRKNTLASNDDRDRRIAGLTRALRSEGYISARVDANFEPVPEDKESLVLQLTLGRPVSFSFVGNSEFTPSEFLQTINLFERKQPFGNNTINILVENIERMYREAGYLYVSIQASRKDEEKTGRVNYTIEIKEGHIATVRKVLFDGNAQLSEDELRKEVRSQYPEQAREILSPKYAVAELLESDSASLQSLLEALGFPNATVSYSIVPVEGEQTVDIRYTIVEGIRAQIHSISLTGLPEMATMSTKPTLPCAISQLNEFTESVLREMREVGYPKASLQVDLGEDDSSAQINISTGFQTHIGAVTVVGLNQTKREVVDDNADLQSGNIWTAARIQDARVRLLRLGLFSRIDIRPADGTVDSPVEDLVIEFTERSLQTLSVGLGANSEYGLHVFGEASDRSLFGDGRSLSLRVDTYYDRVTSDITQGTASLRFLDPYLLDSDYSFTEDLRFQRLDLATYEFDLDRVSLSTYAFKTADDGLSVTIGHSFMRENLSDVSPDAILSDLDTGILNLSFISGIVTWDRRDSPINPSSGYSVGFDYRVASEAIASDANYYSLGARGSYFLPFHLADQRFGIALNSRVDSSWTFAGTDEVPISQRYYLGGRTTIRGYRENSLGPRGEADSVLGGDLLIQNNAELRYMLTSDFWLHTFIDAGTVYLRSRSVSARDLRYSTGFGARYLSPIGPLGVELGIPIDREAGEATYRIHFSIGSAF